MKCHCPQLFHWSFLLCCSCQSDLQCLTKRHFKPDTRSLHHYTEEENVLVKKLRHFFNKRHWSNLLGDNGLAVISLPSDDPSYPSLHSRFLCGYKNEINWLPAPHGTNGRSRNSCRINLHMNTFEQLLWQGQHEDAGMETPMHAQLCTMETTTSRKSR